MATTDAPEVWDNTTPPGGYVCSTCGTPTETEPCRIHQPGEWAECVHRCDGSPRCAAPRHIEGCFAAAPDHLVGADR